MEEKKEFELDLVKLVSKLLSSWKRIAVWTAAFIVVGIIIGFSLPRKYVAGAKLAPEISNTAVTRLSTLSSLAGLNATMLGSTDAVYPMVYPEIVTSAEFITDLYDLPLEFSWKDETVSTNLYGYVLNYVRMPWWSKAVSSCMKGAGKLAAKVAGKNESEEPDTLGTVDPFRLTRKQGRVMKYLSACIESTIDKKTLVITNVVTMQDPVVAATVCREVDRNLQRYVTSYRTDKAVKDLEFYQAQYDESKEAYVAAQRRFAKFVDSHQGVVFQSTKAEQDRLQNEMTLSYQLYSNCTQQLQNAKARVQQETPVFAEVISPTVPLKPAGPSKKKIALVFLVLGLVCGAVDVLLRDVK